jgi:hypothetical protein
MPEISRFLGIVIRMYYRVHAPPHFHAKPRRVRDRRAGRERCGGGSLSAESAPAFFARFTVDDTLVWPNGADFAPEFLYERVRGTR